MGSVHLIHIGDRAERMRAIELFIEVPETWTRFPGNILGVTDKHIEALRHANPPIAYERANKAHLNGEESPVQSR